MLELLVTSHGSSESRGAEQGTGCSWGLRAIHVPGAGRTGERARPGEKRKEGKGREREKKEKGTERRRRKSRGKEMRVTGSSVEEKLMKKFQNRK